MTFERVIVIPTTTTTGEPDSSKRLHPQRRGVSLGSPLPPGVPASLKLTLSNSNRPNGSPLPQIRPYQTVSACNTNHWRGSRRLPVVAVWEGCGPAGSPRIGAVGA